MKNVVSFGLCGPLARGRGIFQSFQNTCLSGVSCILLYAILFLAPFQGSARGEGSASGSSEGAFARANAAPVRELPGSRPESDAYADWMQRGDTAALSGDHGAARQAFESALARAVAVEEKFQARMRVAATYAAESAVPRERAELERALEIHGLSVEQRCAIHLKIAQGHVNEYNSEAALPLVESILSEKTASAGVRAGARLVRARVHARYGVAWAWEKVRTECGEVLSDPAVTGEIRVAAHVLLAEALLTQRQFGSARESMRWVAENERAPALERARQQLAAVRTWLLEGNAKEAQRALSLARELVARLREFSGVAAEQAERDALAARCELFEGLAWCGVGQPARGREFLERVGTMPAQNSASPETREAAVQLRLRGLVREEAGECLKVLMVGSSLTIRGNIPWMLEQMAGSAPAGRPRICVGEHVRMGTGMRTFWLEGEAPDTVRYKIQNEPWDVVVVESFYRMPETDIELYARLYGDLARARGARLVVYETPASRLVSYAEGWSPYHRAVLNVGARLGVPVAPSLAAWMQVLGPSPQRTDFDRLYSDGLHATLKGAYLNACSVYAAVTGETPEGLFRPEGVGEAEAAEFQRAAWHSFTRARGEIAAQRGPGKSEASR